MARPLQIEMAGGLDHVMSRGNERRAIVRQHADRQQRLDWLQRTVQTPSAWGRTPARSWPLPRRSPARSCTASWPNSKSGPLLTIDGLTPVAHGQRLLDGEGGLVRDNLSVDQWDGLLVCVHVPAPV